MKNETGSSPHSQLSTIRSQLIPLGYKQTEVGVIPEEWEVARLSDLVFMGPKNGYSGRSGKEMVDRLTNLIAIFENPSLDFSKNRADGDAACRHGSAWGRT